MKSKTNRKWTEAQDANRKQCNKSIYAHNDVKPLGRGRSIWWGWGRGGAGRPSIRGGLTAIMAMRPVIVDFLRNFSLVTLLIIRKCPR